MAKKEKARYTSIGGQALMEGIMMRGPDKTVMCVRRADGSIVTESIANKEKTIWNKIPLIRGVVGFVESMATGTKTLMRSAEIAIEDELAAVEAEEAARNAAAEEAVTETAENAPAAEEAVTEIIANAPAAEEAVTEIIENAPAAEEAVTEIIENAPAAEKAVTETIENAPAAAEKPVESAAAASEPLSKNESKALAKQEKEAAKKAKKEAKAFDKRKKEAQKNAEPDSGFLLFLSTVFGFALAILLFFYAPTWAADGLFNWVFPRVLPERYADYMAQQSVQNVWRPILEGIIKIIILVCYMLLCTCMKEIRTLFKYHGAEHKTIFCYEAGEELTVENVRKYKRFHPRCGTSFLILMMLVGIIAGMFIKYLLPANIANSNIYYPLIKLGLIPLIMGIGYELLKLCGKYDNILTRIIAAPGMWMQRITTKEPTDDMIECAIAALKPVIPEDGTDMYEVK